MNNQQNINVSLDQTDAVVCEKCEGDIWTPAFMIRKVSALLSPTGRDTMLPVQLFVCSKCGHVNEDMRPS